MRVVTIQQAPLHTTLLSDSRGTPQPLPRDLLRGQKVLLGEAECALHQRGDFPSPILGEYPSSRNCARILSERVILGLMTRVVASVSQVQSWKVRRITDSRGSQRSKKETPAAVLDADALIRC